MIRLLPQVGCAIVMNMTIALMVQFVWNAAVVPLTGAAEIGPVVGWLIGLVLYWIFGHPIHVTVRR